MSPSKGFIEKATACPVYVLTRKNPKLVTLRNRTLAAKMLVYTQSANVSQSSCSCTPPGQNLLEIICQGVTKVPQRISLGFIGNLSVRHGKTTYQTTCCVSRHSITLFRMGHWRSNIDDSHNPEFLI